MRKKPRVTIVGAGSLAQALAALLPRAGYTIAEFVVRTESRRPRAITGIARRIGARVTSAEEANWGGEIVWLAVGDSAIKNCAEKLAPMTPWRGKTVFHSSGALSSDEMQALRRAGAKVASVHPMMTFVRGKVPKMTGVGWTMEGDVAAVTAAKSVVQALKGHSYLIRKDMKPLYHAFGAFLSPLLVVLLDQASEVGRAAGLNQKQVTRLMQPIVAETVENFFANRNEPGKAFSGPLVRGDIATIAQHNKSLQKIRRARELYVALVRSALNSNLPINNRSAIKKLLSLS